MYPDYTNYEIESLDIWSYEVDLFNHNRTATERIEKVECNLISFLRQARRENIRNVNGGLIRPIADSSLDKHEMHNDYYRKYLNLWENKKGILLERIMEGIYMELDEFYNLQENIKISPSTEGFHYWFALKLSQYQDDITYVGDFLDYQLKSNFDSKVDQFNEFLSDVILQYDNETLPERVVFKLKTWISSRTNVPISKKKKQGSSSKEKRSHISFGYKNKNSDTLKTLIFELNRQVNLLNDEHTSVEDLVNVLTADQLSQDLPSIYFECETTQLYYILNKLKPYFNNLTFSGLEESQLFFTKLGHELKAQNLYSSKVDYPKNYLEIDKVFANFQ